MKVLVCMDSSTFADEIINTISRRSWTEDVQFRLVTVILQSGVSDHDNQMLDQAAHILSSRVLRLQQKLKRHSSIKGEVLEGNPADIIKKEAQEWDADLILIGSHGDTGERRLGIGSVAAEVVNNAPCSVEVVKLRWNDRTNRKDAPEAAALVGQKQ